MKFKISESHQFDQDARKREKKIAKYMLKLHECARLLKKTDC